MIYLQKLKTLRVAIICNHFYIKYSYDCVEQIYPKLTYIPSLEELLDIIFAVKYLDIKSLLNISCAKMPTYIKNN